MPDIKLNMLVEAELKAKINNQFFIDIILGQWDKVDISQFPESLVYLFEDEIKSFNTLYNPYVFDQTTGLYKEKTNDDIKVIELLNEWKINYAKFIYAKFSDLQFFEAVVITMVRRCKCLVPLASPTHRLILDSFSNHHAKLDNEYYYTRQLERVEFKKDSQNQ